MSETMFVKPKAGLRVRREEHPRAFVPEAGMTVPRTSYYLRRVREGSLVASEPRKPKPAKE